MAKSLFISNKLDSKLFHRFKGNMLPYVKVLLLFGNVEGSTNRGPLFGCQSDLFADSAAFTHLITFMLSDCIRCCRTSIALTIRVTCRIVIQSRYSNTQHPIECMRTLHSYRANSIIRALSSLAPS